MRMPTPLHESLAWWRLALAGSPDARLNDDEPRCGFYKRKLVRGGPQVPVRIWLEQPVDPETGELIGDEVMRCEVDGKPANAHDQWTWVAAFPISEDDYSHMRARTRWAHAHAADHSITDPYAPVDWNRARIPY